MKGLEVLVPNAAVFADLLADQYVSIPMKGLEVLVHGEPTVFPVLHEDEQFQSL